MRSESRIATLSSGLGCVSSGTMSQSRTASSPCESTSTSQRRSRTKAGSLAFRSALSIVADSFMAGSIDRLGMPARPGSAAVEFERVGELQLFVAALQEARRQCHLLLLAAVLAAARAQGDLGKRHVARDPRQDLVQHGLGADAMEGVEVLARAGEALQVPARELAHLLHAVAFAEELAHEPGVARQRVAHGAEGGRRRG